MGEKNKKASSITCEVCRSTSHKYKCPSCNTKYCSLSCYKTHKEDACEREASERNKEKTGLEETVNIESNVDEEPEEGEITCSSAGEESDNEDKVAGHFLEHLGHSENLHSMLRNKHLREMIKEIDSSQEPGKILTSAMQIPIFTEFVDECLKIIEPQDETKMDL